MQGENFGLAGRLHAPKRLPEERRRMVLEEKGVGQRGEARSAPSGRRETGFNACSHDHAAELGERRRELLRILDAVDPQVAFSQGEGIAAVLLVSQVPM
jgi:hypothetical protein